MSTEVNIGARGYYKLTQEIKNALLEDVNINTVTTGDITDVNLNKQDIFPLGHIIVNNVVDDRQVLRFSISILACDLVNYSKTETIDRFVGNNNLQDVLNTQLAVLNKLTQRLRLGDLYTDMFQVEGTSSMVPFFDRFENQLAGWTCTLDVLVYNDILIC
jgi:hypothetical protein